MENKSEKRKSTRYQCSVPVESKEGTSFSQTQTVDISKTGIGFISSQVISVAEKIPIEIAFTPNGEAVLVMGEVKWIRPLSGSKKYRVGMTFTDVLQGTKSRLQQYFSQ